MGECLAGLPSSLPAVARAPYHFGDPQNLGRGWVGAAIMLLWFGPLTALPLYIAKKVHGTHEWVSSTIGVMAAASAMSWIHGGVPLRTSLSVADRTVGAHRTGRDSPLFIRAGTRQFVATWLEMVAPQFDLRHPCRQNPPGTL